MLFTALFSVSPFAPQGATPAGRMPSRRPANRRALCAAEVWRGCLMDVGRSGRRPVVCGGMRLHRRGPLTPRTPGGQILTRWGRDVQFTSQRDTVYPGVQGAYYWTEVNCPAPYPATSAGWRHALWPCYKRT